MCDVADAPSNCNFLATIILTIGNQSSFGGALALTGIRLVCSPQVFKLSREQRWNSLSLGGVIRPSFPWFIDPRLRLHLMVFDFPGLNSKNKIVNNIVHHEQYNRSISEIFQDYYAYVSTVPWLSIDFTVSSYFLSIRYIHSLTLSIKDNWYRLPPCQE